MENRINRESEFIMVKDAACMLGVSMPTMYKMVKAEGFPKIMIGSKIMIPKTRMIEWLDQKASDGAKIL